MIESGELIYFLGKSIEFMTSMESGFSYRSDEIVIKLCESRDRSLKWIRFFSVLSGYNGFYSIPSLDINLDLKTDVISTTDLKNYRVTNYDFWLCEVDFIIENYKIYLEDEFDDTIFILTYGRNTLPLLNYEQVDFLRKLSALI